MKKKRTNEPKLTIELVPRSCWGQNLRNIISKEQWTELRDRREAFSGQCAICGAGNYDSPLHLHEVWNYDERRGLQKLVDLQPICSDCHDVKHFGRASKMGLAEKALQHLLTVNNWDVETAYRYIEQVTSIWEKRSERTYKLDVSLVKRYHHNPKLHLEWLADPTRRSKNKYDSMQWARSILNANALIVDTETTGLLTRSYSEIIQIAVLNIKGQLLYDRLIKPRRRIPKRTIEIHHITDEKVSDCPKFDAIYDELCKILSGKTLVAYNAKFDKGILQQTCSLNKLPMIECKWECAMLNYRDYIDSPFNARLPNATHVAAADCRATLDLIHRMAKGLPVLYQ